PMVNGFQSTFGGGANKTDAFILKVAANGASVIADSYLGGGNDETGEAMFLDASGNVYVTGSTRSDVPAPFPTTPGVFQPAYAASGGNPPDAFIAKINASGPSLVLTWSSCLGSTSDDWAYDVAADATGVWVTGYTKSSGFPVTAGAFSTTLSGTQDAFLTKVNLTGTAILWSTFLGGTGTELGRAVVVDAAGNAYVGGETTSTNFPIFGGGFKTTLGGPQDQFAAKLNSTGSSVLWSTYMGGSGTEYMYDMQMD